MPLRLRAVLFVVDSADRERLGLAASELGAMLAEEELRGSALAVLANKSDLPGAASPAEVAGALKLAALKDRRWQLFRTSALRGDGLPETMEWCALVLLPVRRPAPPPSPRPSIDPALIHHCFPPTASSHTTVHNMPAICILLRLSRLSQTLTQAK